MLFSLSLRFAFFVDSCTVFVIVIADGSTPIAGRSASAFVASSPPVEPEAEVPFCLPVNGDAAVSGS